MDQPQTATPPALHRRSSSELGQGMGVWVWLRRPARITENLGEGRYRVEFLDEGESMDVIERDRLDPLDREEASRFLPKPRLEPDTSSEGGRTPLRKFMDEWPISRAQLIKLLGYSPPKVDRLIASQILPLTIAVQLAEIFEIEVDPETIPEEDRPRLAEALNSES
jgi:hypothetical protein